MNDYLIRLYDVLEASTGQHF